MRIGLFGGSFDPIHYGHLHIANCAINTLKLDELWFIPVLNNPFKNEKTASANECESMIQLAIAHEPRFKICDIELKADPYTKSYTYHTLLKLHQLYPDDEFYYLIGDDQANAFNRWYQADKLPELATFVCFPRTGYSLASKNIETYSMLRIECDPMEVSSSAIREGNFNHAIPDVVQYFTMKGLYLNSIVKRYMSSKRYQHTCSMAKIAIDIAKSNHLDETKAYVAGMLHDIAKEMDEKQATTIMEHDYSEHLNTPRAVWHQWLSAYLAKTVFYIDDQEILQAITNHTTANVPMSSLDKCIYCADKYDPFRGFDSSKEIALCKENLDEGFKQSLIDFVNFSKKKHRSIDPCFDKVYKEYVKK